MTKAKAARSPASRDENDQVKKYESLPLSEVMDELRGHGIDPRPTIKRVLSLVRSKIERREHRKES